MDFLHITVQMGFPKYLCKVQPSVFFTAQNVNITGGEGALRYDKGKTKRKFYKFALNLSFASNSNSYKGSSINYVITFGGLGRPPPPYVIL